jgi:hypothetical protein
VFVAVCVVLAAMTTLTQMKVASESRMAVRRAVRAARAV